MARVGIIGLGLVGSALAERLISAGFDVGGYDLDAAKTAALERLGGMPLESNRDAARYGRRLILSLPTSDVVAEVLEEIAAELTEKLVIDTTTGLPEVIPLLGTWVADRGGQYVDATIAGSSAQVRRGEVVVMLGGADAAVAEAMELIEAFARRSFHLGTVGSGARMKLVVNLVLGLHRAVLAEGLSFAKACGIDPATALAVLEAGPAFSRVMETKGPKMLRGDFEPEARLAQHHKDVKLILQVGLRADARLPLTQLHDLLLAALVNAGCGDLDNSAIVRAYAPGGLVAGEGGA